MSGKTYDTSELTKYFPEMKSRIPIKKPRGKNLKKKEKRHNRKLGKERVVIEHTIGKMKKEDLVKREGLRTVENYMQSSDHLSKECMYGKSVKEKSYQTRPS